MEKHSKQLSTTDNTKIWKYPIILHSTLQIIH